MVRRVVIAAVCMAACAASAVGLRDVVAQISAAHAPAAAWTPAQLSPMLWLDASDLSASTLTASNTVSKWGDMSGNNVAVYQTTGGKQPTVGTNAATGKVGLLFDGSNDAFSISNLTSTATNYTFVVVHKCTSTGARYTFDTETGRLVLFPSTPLSNYAYVDGSGYRGDTVAASTNTHQIWWGCIATNSGFIAKDGTNINSNLAYTQRAIGGLTAFGERYSAPSTWFVGYVHEFLIIKGAISAENRTLLETYLRNKWGTP